MALSAVNDFTLPELVPYITGKRYLDTDSKMVDRNKEWIDKFMELLSSDKIAQEFLKTLDTPSQFYDTMLDFKEFIPSKYWSECFYSAKCGKYYTEIPSICVFFLQRAYEKCNGIPNLLLKVLPYSFLNKCFQYGFFSGGLTLSDAICNVCNPQYHPLSKEKLKNRIGDFTEIYIQSTDMVAAVPNKIADFLSNDAILKIEETPDGLAVEGKLLRTMANYVGAINSTYDLRALL